MQETRHQLNPWVGKFPWGKAWPLTPVFLPGGSPWTEEPGDRQSMGSQRVRRNWATKHSTESHQQNKLFFFLFFFFFFTTAQGMASETTHSLSSISSSKMWISHCESVTHKLHWDNRMVFSLLMWWLWEIGSDCLEHCCKEFKLSRRKHQELWVEVLGQH